MLLVGLLACFFAVRAAEPAPRLCPLGAEVEAHLILEREVHFVAKAAGYALPSECVFHPAHDRYTHARMSRAVRRGSYRCAFCAESFATIDKLERHMESHAGRISNAHSKCYSDYCLMLGCPSSLSQLRQAPLNPTARALQHHKCKDILSSCFDRHSKQGRELRGLFVDKFCSRFTDEDLTEVMHDSQDSIKVLKYVGFAFLVMGLVIFYILLWLWRSESSTTSDLQSTSYSSRLRRFFNAPKKTKGY